MNHSYIHPMNVAPVTLSQLQATATSSLGNNLNKLKELNSLKTSKMIADLHRSIVRIISFKFKQYLPW